MSQALTQWLESHNLGQPGKLIYNPDRTVLISEAIKSHEGVLTPDGALNAITAPYTGRSPKDKFIVDNATQTDMWWGEVNQRVSVQNFTDLKQRIAEYLSERPLYVIDCAIGSDPDYQYSVRLVAEFAWQALAVQNLFIYEAQQHVHPDITILAASDFHIPPEVKAFNSEVGICIDLMNKTILVAGSRYAGEIKKSVFSVMNALMPEVGVLPMHCSANVGESGDVALYFGLSGTGKTALSASLDRRLVGDDEHGWGDDGIFNFEGGCYAKTIRLSQQMEPVIWKAVNQTGTVLENVILAPESHEPDFDDSTITENTRAAYPLSQVDNIMPGGMAEHPANIFFLTADAFGVLPPIAKLNFEDAIYYFLSGYTSKLAGTERGLGQKPTATFSTCFAEPFLPLKPKVYAALLKEKIERHQSQVWLVNTGWTGGGYQTGYRMPLPHTRRMVDWILSGKHHQANYHIDLVFGLAVPNEVPDVPTDLLYPEQSWEDQAAFLETAKQLKEKFEENFAKLGHDYYGINQNNSEKMMPTVDRKK